MMPMPLLELEVAPPENTASLGLVTDLFQALKRRGVRYCHWKSNARLAQALHGQTDLDLLVDRKHSQAFRRILNDHHIKFVLAAPGKGYPAIENYLGFDPASGRQFHLHVHYQLVLGEQFVKNYRLPLEAHFLNSVRLQQGVQVPAPEWELIVLSLRALLKYRDRDALKDMLSIRSPGLPGYLLKEIKWLLAQTSMARVAQTLAQAPEIVPAAIVLEFLQTVIANPRAGYRLYRLRARARRALRCYQRYNRWQASRKYFQEMWRKASVRRKALARFSPNRKMTLPNGGQTLALVGADGAGKSTMGQILCRWLAWKLDARLYYLGSKQPSRRSELLYLLFRMARRGQRALGRGLGEKNILTRWLDTLRQTLLYSHHLSIGYDRYRRYRASRREAMAGSMVLYDRFPLQAPLDGPKIHLAAAEGGGAIANAFARLEQQLYDKFRPPDYLVVLDVSPEVSWRRKPDHDRLAICAKSRFVRALIAQAQQEDGRLNLIRIDADQPFEVVLGQLKTAIWEMI